MTEEKIKEQKLEINAIHYLVKRLKPLLNSLESNVAKEDDKRKKRFEELSEYKTYEDAHEAYGWGYITEAELRRIETQQWRVDNIDTKARIALTALRRFVSRLNSDARSLEFELLPEEEQIKCMLAREEHEERMKKFREEGLFPETSGF